MSGPVSVVFKGKCGWKLVPPAVVLLEKWGFRPCGRYCNVDLGHPRSPEQPRIVTSAKSTARPRRMRGPKLGTQQTVLPLGLQWQCLHAIGLKLHDESLRVV